jgi:GNAT superfamily N-acetyltransferase
MNITFKPTRDVEQAMAMIEGLGDFFDEDSYKDLKHDIKVDKVYGAFDGKKMLGFIIFCELNEDVVELTWMAVDKKLRGMGVGKKLIEYGISTVNAKNKYKICYLKTIGEGDRQRSFKATRQFYLRNGFLPLESVKPFPGWHKDKWVQSFVKCLGH